MTFHYSEPFEMLVEKALAAKAIRCRVAIVGSGYGGSIAAYRLARQLSSASEREFDVMVLERGKEYALGEFPNSFDELPKHVQVTGERPAIQPRPDALFDIRVGDGVDVIVGSGLGGTSLINANVALAPDPAMWQHPTWPQRIRSEAEPFEGSLLDVAFKRVGELLNVATEDERKGLRDYAKFAAFEAYSKALGIPARPAPITVTLTEGRVNSAGLPQPKCTGCGNCVTGCNVGAKNTLAMNLIPLAHARGARFFTGAEVLEVKRSNSPSERWTLRVRPSSRGTRERLLNSVMEIHAQFVILCAGTLGSTEILQRSKSLRIDSNVLGGRFSTNGDAVATSYAESEPVNALGSRNYSHPEPCGPTITAVAQFRPGGSGKSEPFTLEDGAIPAGLTAIFGETVTTAAQLGRLGDNRLPAWYTQKNKSRDPLAVHPGAIASSQVFLIMSDDKSSGRLEFRNSLLSSDSARTIPVWRAAGSNDHLTWIDKRLGEHDRKRGLRGGQFVRNPLWQLLPESASNTMSGKFPDSRYVSVHPLGGCPMADSGANGVVNHAGEVFSGPGDTVHEGLLVMDGSIVPCALGVNPFLTIAALAWRACDLLEPKLGSEAVDQREVKTTPNSGRIAPVDSEYRSLVIRETLLGQLLGGSEQARDRLKRSFPLSCRWFEEQGLVLQIQSDTGGSQEAVNGGKVAISASLKHNTLSEQEVTRAHMSNAPEGHLVSIAEGNGWMTLMSPDEPVVKLGRTLAALWAYLQRRESLWDLARDQREKLSGNRSLQGSESNWWSVVKAFWNVAEMHAVYRIFEYDIALRTPDSKELITLKGTKRIAWRTDNPRLWHALLHLPAKMKLAGQTFRAGFTVDAKEMFGHGLLDVSRSQARDVNLTRGLLEVGGLVARFARSILQSSFWEFGSPNYPDAPLTLNPHLPDSIAGVRKQTLDLPVGASSQACILKLHCYRQAPDSNAAPVLLLHGLAQGSLIFGHPKLPKSMTEYLLEKKYDVWLLDYRLSNALGPIASDNWSIDDIGQLDVPAAVREVLKSYPGEKLHVFAHCVGAVALEMAILHGLVTPAQLASVVLNAIHPWTVPSGANQARVTLAAFGRERVGDAYFNPIIPSKTGVTGADSLIDRLAFSMARLGENDENDQGHKLGIDADLAQAICDRMTFTYGRMWLHRNTSSIHRYWKDLVGQAPASVQRHLFHILLHKRILDRDGRNIYLTDANVSRWRGVRTLFMHGEKSTVFNPFSASRSANRLNKILNDGSPPYRTVVYAKRVEGFGHMDVILADSAHRASYPYVHNFFQGKFDSSNVCTDDDTGEGLSLEIPDDAIDTHWQAKLAPEIGPVLRAARMINGRLKVRAWVELPSKSTAQSHLIQPGIGTAYQFRLDPDETQWWVDVELDPADYASLDIRAIANGSGVGFNGLKGDLSAALNEPSADPSWLRRLRQRDQQGGGALEDCHFIVGSCRYPGSPFDRRGADEAFSGMKSVLENDGPCDLLFLIGDQIYADAYAGALDPIAWRERYNERYREAFIAKSMRTVLENIPTHFAVDDHEIADDFAGTVIKQPMHGKVAWAEDWNSIAISKGYIEPSEFAFAKATARAYMDGGRSTRPFAGAAPAGAFWYALDHDSEINCPAFILDTRTEREMHPGSLPPKLLFEKDGSGRVLQLEALKTWLTAVSGIRRPKFIFSGSVIAPLIRDAHEKGAWMREDGLAAYPDELSEIVASIVSQQIQGVVFVGGDLHLSCVAKLTLASNTTGSYPPIDAWQIVASPVYAPLTFVNLAPADFDWGQSRCINAGDHRITYVAELQSDANSQFTKVSATSIAANQWKIAIVAFDSTGHVVGTRHQIEVQV